MQSIILVIMLFNIQFESFQEEFLIEHYLNYHEMEHCDFYVYTHNDTSFSIYYDHKSIIYVSQDKITIELSNFDFYNNEELNKFIHFFIYNYIFSSEYVYLQYTYSDIKILKEFEEHLTTFIFSGMNIYGSIYSGLQENTKIWTSNMALNNNQMITCIEEIKKKY